MKEAALPKKDQEEVKKDVNRAMGIPEKFISPLGFTYTVDPLPTDRCIDGRS